MTTEQRLECFEKVNNAETFKELEEALTFIASLSEGMIMGKTKNYTLEKILANIDNIKKKLYPVNTCTREYGIRSKVIYLTYYGEK